MDLGCTWFITATLFPIWLSGEASKLAYNLWGVPGCGVDGWNVLVQMPIQACQRCPTHISQVYKRGGNVCMDLGCTWFISNHSMSALPGWDTLGRVSLQTWQSCPIHQECVCKGWEYMYRCGMYLIHHKPLYYPIWLIHWETPKLAYNLWRVFLGSGWMRYPFQFQSNLVRANPYI